MTSDRDRLEALLADDSAATALLGVNGHRDGFTTIHFDYLDHDSGSITFSVVVHAPSHALFRCSITEDHGSDLTAGFVLGEARKVEKTLTVYETVREDDGWEPEPISARTRQYYETGSLGL